MVTTKKKNNDHFIANGCNFLCLKGKSTNSSHFALFQKLIGEVFNIVSQQSTARPGCIIELDAITNKVNNSLIP